MEGSGILALLESISVQVNSLLEIWRQMREDTDGIISSGKTPLHSFLAEPPHVRERLIQEIKFFVSYLKKEKTDFTSQTLRTDHKQSHLIEYVTSGGVGRSRPQSAVSVSEAPLRTADGRYV